MGRVEKRIYDSCELILNWITITLVHNKGHKSSCNPNRLNTQALHDSKMEAKCDDSKSHNCGFLKNCTENKQELKYYDLECWHHTYHSSSTLVNSQKG